MSTTIFNFSFWRQLGWSLLRTAIAAVTAFVPGLVERPGEVWAEALSVVSLALIVQVATSLKGLPDEGGVTWWQLVISRSLRTFGQVIAGAAGSAALLTDLPWHDVLQAAISAAVTTVLLTALTILPQDTVQPVQLVEEARETDLLGDEADTVQLESWKDEEEGGYGSPQPRHFRPQR